ncbi:hypothetical protein FOL47_000999 [Perkinsus chesapeaki]|uniref:Uncharacterized protein n=1 Tax=Perkinsus chesapeaki TaxID=330153 RepID=A0A7J6KU95_PERCH|nr:hypothetical protein FOL47_000999 [Perkinsus chesapeaki]
MTRKTIFNKYKMVMGVVVQLSMMWSTKCQTGTYMGYTNGKQQCIEVVFNYSSTRKLMQVELTVQCTGLRVCSPELDYDWLVPHYPFAVEPFSEKDLGDYREHVYDSCQLKSSSTIQNEFRTFFPNDDDSVIRVEFYSEIVSLKKGKC